LNIKYKFNNLSFIQKIELYLIPLFIILFVFNNLPTNSVSNNTNLEIRNYKNKIQHINHNKHYKKIDILNQLEQIAHKLNINIIKIHFPNKFISITINGSTINQINFLYFSEKVLAINSYQFYYEQNTLNLIINFISDTFKPLDNINLIETIKIANNFTTLNRDFNTTFTSSKSQAIFGNFVLLDGQWYKKGDKYKKYIIYKIYNNYIELKEANKITKMELFNDK